MCMFSASRLKNIPPAPVLAIGVISLLQAAVEVRTYNAFIIYLYILYVYV